MFGIRLMFLLAVMGGIIAFIADKMGSKIGKKKLSVFGLRPHDTSGVADGPFRRADFPALRGHPGHFFGKRPHGVVRHGKTAERTVPAYGRENHGRKRV